nr:uncharacterized protein CTRU02_04241 [Colletotrichum truncatum]KAF6796280.1 hypothetical protein CTRU02_04241 [Colletotrichum truncatum]
MRILRRLRGTLLVLTRVTVTIRRQRPLKVAPAADAAEHGGHVGEVHVRSAMRARHHGALVRCAETAAVLRPLVGAGPPAAEVVLAERGVVDYSRVAVQFATSCD